MLFCSNFEFPQAPLMPPSFNTLDYSLDHHHHHQHEELMKFRVGETSSKNNNEIVDYMPQTQPPTLTSSSGGCFYGTGTTSSTSFDKLSFADVMQFANQAKNCDESGLDPVYFLKFPVLNDKMEDQNMMLNPDCGDENNDDRYNNMVSLEDKSRVEEEGMILRENDENRVSESLQHENLLQKNSGVQENKNKRKRPRSVKTSEEVESQRMTHIAVERNRRKQMNEHLRVLRSLMPGSYVQRVCVTMPHKL